MGKPSLWLVQEKFAMQSTLHSAVQVSFSVNQHIRRLKGIWRKKKYLARKENKKKRKSISWLQKNLLLYFLICTSSEIMHTTSDSLIKMQRKNSENFSHLIVSHLLLIFRFVSCRQACNKINPLFASIYYWYFTVNKNFGSILHLSKVKKDFSVTRRS